jgi:chemotaxis protein CheC
MERYLTDFERDQLREVVNIGAGNASTALSEMVSKNVIIDVPEVFVGRIEEVTRFLGESEKIMTVVLLQLLGDIQGGMLLMFSPEGALNLASLLTRGREKDIRVFDEMDRSALREVGNILSCACATALYKFLDINILPSVPDMATDMLGSVADTVLAEIMQTSDTALVFKVSLRVEEEGITGQLFFFFDPKATGKILEATKKKFKGE